MSRLRVHLHDRAVGTLEVGDGHPLDLRFTYDAGHLARDDARALSHSLPLREEPFALAARHWFANLLPEGAARQHLAARYALAIHDDFGLLAAIGRECAGAVSLWREDESPQCEPEDRVPLPDADIEAWIGARPRGAVPFGDHELRLSLAGAQDKIGVVLREDGALALPLGSAASSHVLKVSNPDYPDLVLLEAFAMRLAHACGLDVADVALRFTPTPSLLVRRFDRVRLDPLRYARVHQEDFCQALGIAPEHKYGIDGGPA